MSSPDIYQPYTYLIGWSEHNLWYYGVRFAKGCNPADLWVRYFTSSKLVAKCRCKYGEPDMVTVRRTFKCRTSAIDWEQKGIETVKGGQEPYVVELLHIKTKSRQDRPSGT